jgi:hypothetical protein
MSEHERIAELERVVTLLVEERLELIARTEKLEAAVWPPPEAPEDAPEEGGIDG